MEENGAALGPSNPAADKRGTAKSGGSPARLPKSASARGRRRHSRVRYSNRVKVLLLYLLAWSLAMLIPLAGLVWVYPYTLAATGPALAEHAAAALPFAKGWLEEAIRETAVTEGMSVASMTGALAARDLQWRVFLAGCQQVCWLVSLCLQVIWRGMYRHSLGVASVARRALRTYRITLFVVLLVNGMGALLVYFLGMRFIGGKTLWDWLISMNGFGLNLAAAWLCFRLGAPPAISGKRAFFKRL